ncbi:TlpA family protein disulfide reductase [Fulvimarina endophytica]|uniref:TlpA family protein disulfide reductase n=1 Tax=Fulvimarina endophytica TaxID=2293836 RepID=A0A371X5K3_9HYPH|nr:TlpA disulfide reductase family protein [Fulvimarina endophytica]RFC64506.1 TlpA family protein disulfide reductase [Fulvimarina endophytica]
MTALSLGPFLFAGDRLAALIGLFAFFGLSAILSLRFGGDLAGKAVNAFIIGLLTARTAHVAAHWPSFAEEPERILMIWQGGFMLWPGLVAAAVYLLWTFADARRRIAAIGALTAGLFVWNIAVQLIATTEAIASPPTPMQTLDGRSVTLAEFEGRPVVVNLWATWCPPCRREMPMMTEMARERDDVAFVFANQGEGASRVIRYFNDEALNAEHVTLDQSTAVARHYNVRGYPATLFLDEDGVLQDMHFGEISREGLSAAIDGLTR